jgi:hypothetical protein
MGDQKDTETLSHGCPWAPSPASRAADRPLKGKILARRGMAERFRTAHLSALLSPSPPRLVPCRGVTSCPFPYCVAHPSPAAPRPIPYERTALDDYGRASIVVGVTAIGPCRQARA